MRGVVGSYGGRAWERVGQGYEDMRCIYGATSIRAIVAQRISNTMDLEVRFRVSSHLPGIGKRSSYLHNKEDIFYLRTRIHSQISTARPRGSQMPHWLLRGQWTFNSQILVAFPTTTSGICWGGWGWSVAVVEYGGRRRIGARREGWVGWH